MGEQSVAFQRRSTKLLILYGLMMILGGIFLLSAIRTVDSDRHLPRQTATINDRSLRGEITSHDQYTLSLPHKIYKAVVYSPGIDPKKRNMFVRLFSIYSGMSEEEIEKSFLDKKGKPKRGYVTITKKIDAGTAIHLKRLAYKFRRLRVFRPITNSRGIDIVYGLDIIESGEQREFPFGDVLEPVLGYINKTAESRYVGVEGVKGLEKHYQNYLSAGQNGSVHGKRDVAGIIIRNGSCQQTERIDGKNLHLNIPLSLQRRIEFAIDQAKRNTDAQEVIAGVMDSRTGRVISLASTERYDPAHIQQEDLKKLDLKFVEYPYESGSVIKPFTLAIALEHHKVKPSTWFDVENGKMYLNNKTPITDDEPFDSLTATDIIVHSSNIGISKISWRITGEQMHDGFTAFGLGKPSGIDLSRELHGKIKSGKRLEHKLHRANQSYGYGMTTTFAQLLKAYSSFNNGGVCVTPRIVAYIQDSNGTKHPTKPKYGDHRAISSQTANTIKTILKEVVKRGTGVSAQYPGLEIGGKTGTAQIPVRGHYKNIYNSSFFGFANDDKGHKYTIGVLVIRPSKQKMYFASKSAAPAFKSIVGILADQGFLKPNMTLIEQRKKAEKEKKLRAIAKKKQQARTRKVKAMLKAQREEILRKQREAQKRRTKRIKRKKHKRPAPHKARTTNPQIKATPPRPRSRTPHDVFPDMF